MNATGVVVLGRRSAGCWDFKFEELVARASQLWQFVPWRCKERKRVPLYVVAVFVVCVERALRSFEHRAFPFCLLQLAYYR